MMKEVVGNVLDGARLEISVLAIMHYAAARLFLRPLFPYLPNPRNITYNNLTSLPEEVFQPLTALTNL